MNDVGFLSIILQNNIFSGLFVGQNLITLKEVDSTSNFLKNILSNSKPLIEGTVIMAESQFAGRGQQQNKWHSEPGKNLTFSLLLKPSFLAIDQQFDLTRVISLGVINALGPYLGDQLKIKWPNDIYYGNRKLGGILIENMVQGSQIKNSVIGIGLNINQDIFPPHVPNPVSLKQILHKDYDLKKILSQICKNIETAYILLRSGQSEHIRAAYLQRLYWLDEEKSFRANGRQFTGTIKAIKANGLLVVDNGTRELEFNLKEIEFLNR